MLTSQVRAHLYHVSCDCGPVLELAPLVLLSATILLGSPTWRHGIQVTNLRQQGQGLQQGLLLLQQVAPVQDDQADSSSASVDFFFSNGYGAKAKPPGDRRFESLFPFTRVPFWVPIFDPLPKVHFEKSTEDYFFN